MYNVIIWGTGEDYSTHYNSVKLLELTGQINVIGVITSNNRIKESIDSYPIIKAEDITSINFDFCFVGVPSKAKVLGIASRLGIPGFKFIPMYVLSVPGFNLDGYIMLLANTPTIFSINCWAGISYHRLGLPFLSPTINLFQSGTDFNKFILNLDKYLTIPVVFEEIHYDSNCDKHYPVGRIDDILLHFNHYDTFEEAHDCWERRKSRINWNNIIVISQSDSIDVIKEFESIPFEHKYIFTSLDIESPSCLYVNTDNSGQLWPSVIATANGNNNYFDLIKFLNHKDDAIRIK